MVAACEADVVDVEEAKAVAMVVERPVELPPRGRVDRDVTEILQVEESEDQRRLETFDIDLDQAPPETGDPWVLARF